MICMCLFPRASFPGSLILTPGVKMRDPGNEVEPRDDTFCLELKFEYIEIGLFTSKRSFNLKYLTTLCLVNRDNKRGEQTSFTLPIPNA